MKTSALQALLCCAGVLLLTSCASTNRGDASVGVDPRTAEVIKSSKMPYSQGLAETVDRVKTGATEDDDRTKVFKGSGIMVKGQTPWQPMPAQGATPVTPPARGATAVPTTPPPATRGVTPPAQGATPVTPTPPVQATPATPMPPAQGATTTPARLPITPAIKGGTTPPPAVTPPATPPATTPPTTAPATKGATPATHPTTTSAHPATTPAAKGTPAKGAATTTTPAAKGATPAKRGHPLRAEPTKSATATPPAKGAATLPAAGATPTPPAATTPPPAVTPPATTPPAVVTPVPPVTPPTPPAAGTPAPPATSSVVTPRPPTPTAPPTAPSALPSARGGGNIVLNFEAADLREVIRNILGDILGEAYLIDPTVNGQVTIRTSSGIPRDSLYATLETLLRMNNATMIQEAGVYKILPAAMGFKGSATPQLGNSQRPLPKGFSVQIVPLRYVSAKEMLKILDPFAKDSQSSLRADEVRNLVILSGTELELRHLIDTVEMFDINWMAGMSVGMFKLRNVDVKGLSQDLMAAQAGDNGMGLMLGAMKFIPIERMNMLLVVTPQPDQLDEVKKWIEKFDSDDNTEVPRLYVYSLRYARAEKLAPLLQQAFTGKNTAPTRTQGPTTAPGTAAVTMGGGRLAGSTSTAGRSTSGYGSSYGGSSYNSSGGFGSFSSNRTGTTTGTTTGTNRPGTTAATNRPGAVPAVGISGGGMGIAQDIQVVPDEDNNAILIVATPAEYALAEQAIKKLDIPQRQVVIEVTIAEVTLSDAIDVSSQWFFSGSANKLPAGAAENAVPSMRSSTVGTGPATGSLAANAFSLLISRDKFGAFFTANDVFTNVKVVANPHIAALDNQEAHIEITNQIPYQNTTYISGYYDPNNTSGYNGSYPSASWNYVSPGTIVTIKPHINEGGNVTMEADIEFSAQSGPPPGEGAAPPLTNRAITSQLMVPSGSTMVIGGLIRDDKTTGTSGVPGLSRIPVLGALFGSQNWSNTRTELIIFLTPRVIDSEETRRAVIQDLRYRMDNLEGFLIDSKALPSDLIRRERREEEKDNDNDGKSGSI
ncbi:MAG: type II secretion system secretin GspD [Betaproteobacteria bacterium]|nr:type II secretion system secretin GspD [Betaproteobacteria bacterium]